MAAERESARAVELNPNAAEIHHLRSYALRPLNRMDEALQEQRKAMELDPFARPYQLGYALIRMRQFDAALNEARIRTDVQPNNADLHDLLSQVYFLKGMEQESEEESERYLQLAGEKDQLAEQIQVYRRGGFRAVLEWKVDVLKRKAAKQYVSPTEFVDAYAQLGRKEETIRYLEESYQKRAPHLVFLQSDPTLDFLHSDPRYRAIVNKMGLPPALCLAKILSGSDINSLHSFLSRGICYDCCSCSATSDYGGACSPAAFNRIEACSLKISLSGNSWPC